MPKNIKTKIKILATMLLIGFFAKGQESEPLPVMASKPDNAKITQNKEVKKDIIKTEINVPLTPWLLSRTQNQRTSSLLATPANVLVNNNNGANATGNFTQSETSILVYGNNVITGFNDAGSLTGGAHKFTGYSRSTDGGVTFTDGGTLPTNIGGDAGDPVLARNNTTGRLYFSTLGFDVRTIQLFKSDDNGLTWSAPVNATPGGAREDKQWLTVDNFAGGGNGNVYLVSRNFGAGNGIYFYRSTDNGTTFGPGGGTLIVLGSQGAFIVVAPDHSIEAFWLQAGAIRMRKSTDFGATFGAAVIVASGLAGPQTNGGLGLTGIRQGTIIAAPFRSNSFPHAAVNPVSGHIYVTFNDNPAGVDKGDIYMVVSTDGGATWGARVKVNDDFSTTDQWQPTIAVSPDGLNLGIFYYSRLEDPANNNLFKYHARTAAITGSIVTFSPSGPVSTVAAIPEFGRDSVVNTTYMGDYETAAATATDFNVTWADSRDNLAIGPPRKDPNVYFAKVPLTGVPGVPVLTSTTPPVITGGNGNGKIDPNECNELSISLTNVGTAAAQNISGTITSSTPGVIITQGSSAYPDLAPGASASNTTAFKIATSTGYVCGTNVQLTLTVNYDGGSVVLNLVLPAFATLGATVQFDNNTSTPIADLTTTNIPINVSGFTGSVGKVTISMYLTHTSNGDLQLSLISPDGTTVPLSINRGGGGQNFGSSCANRTAFDDAAVTSITAGTAPFVGTFKPEGSLALFNGKSGVQINGNWTLRIADVGPGDAGNFFCASLFVAPAVCVNNGAPIICPANITTTVNQANCTALVTYAVGIGVSTPTVTYSFSGATAGSGSGTGSGSSFNIGTTTVTVSVSNGCVTSSCSFTVTVNGVVSTCSIASIPSNNVYTGGVPTNLYLGYGPQSTTLQVSATPPAGAPYTYLWIGPNAGLLSSTTSAAPTFTPTTGGTYLFTVQVTNSYGCVSTCSITICVLDIKVYKNGSPTGKVYVCHAPPGNPTNVHTLSISTNAVPDHLLSHPGDKLGNCTDVICGTNARLITTSPASEKQPEPIATVLQVNVTPNPAVDVFRIRVTSSSNAPIVMRIMDAAGIVRSTTSSMAKGSFLTVGRDLKSGTYYAEVIQGNQRKMVKLIKFK
ncbi:MAG: proprotein convertase P-domain-containing protein [Chitinophagaceae bacterium]